MGEAGGRLLGGSGGKAAAKANLAVKNFVFVFFRFGKKVFVFFRFGNKVFVFFRFSRFEKKLFFLLSFCLFLNSFWNLLFCFLTKFLLRAILLMIFVFFLAPFTRLLPYFLPKRATPDTFAEYLFMMFVCVCCCRCTLLSNLMAALSALARSMSSLVGLASALDGPKSYHVA